MSRDRAILLLAFRPDGTWEVLSRYKFMGPQEACLTPKPPGPPTRKSHSKKETIK